MMVDRHLDEDDFREPWARERSAGDEEPLESGNEEFAPNAEEDDDEDEPDLDGLDDVMRECSYNYQFLYRRTDIAAQASNTSPAPNARVLTASAATAYLSKK